jgi:hypothetical protein
MFFNAIGHDCSSFIPSMRRHIFAAGPELEHKFPIGNMGGPIQLRVPRHLSEQYRTASQTFAHFLRQTKGLPQVAQVFCGRSDFLRILGITRS